MQSTMNSDLQSIMKEGWLEKESRFLKSWRNQRRWFVLTQTNLYTFKYERQYKDPTEVVSLKSVSTIKSCDEETNRQNSFVCNYSILDNLDQKIDTPEGTFYMVAQNNNEKEQWIGAIGKAMVKMNIRKNSSDDD